MNSTSLTDYFETSIRLFRQTYSASSINQAFEDAMTRACPVVRSRPALVHEGLDAPLVVATMTPADMHAIMQDFRSMYVGQMTRTELHWFDLMFSVVEGGRALAGKQVVTVNSISERLAGMAIIL